MKFVVIGKDHTDSNAPSRRQDARQAHLMGIKALKEDGKIVYAIALLEEGKMIGSIIVFNMPTRNDLDKYLKTEPYIQNNVWENVEVRECIIPDMFK